MGKKPGIPLPELAKIFDRAKQSVAAALKNAMITRKKKTFAYAERSFLSVMIYIAQISWFVKVMSVDKFVFVDESGLNRECRRLYARVKRSIKVCERISGKKNRAQKHNRGTRVRTKNRAAYSRSKQRAFDKGGLFRKLV